MTIREWFMPIQGSEHAGKVDSLYMAMFWLTVVFFGLITFLTVYFSWKYKRTREGVLTPNIAHHLGLELLWSVVPALICLVLFFWGFNDYVDASIAPNDAIEINVSGKKWLWSFEYPDGSRSIANLHVPVNKPIKLIVTAEDVLHDFFIPAMRQKTDAVPGQYHEISFTPTKTGKFQVFCAEYCGKDHSAMMANLFVDSESDYNRWLVEGDEELKKMPPVEVDKLVYENKGCNSCHSIDGSRIAGGGPTFKGLYGRTERFTDGTSVTAEANYIRESILNPQLKIVQGYEPIMPTFQGLLKEPEIVGVIAYIKTLK